jgi:hypothetical protein
MEDTGSKKTSRKTTSTSRKSRTKINGLGDAVEAVTSATGIKAAVEWFSDVTGIDCGCDARKEKLNKLVRFSRVECLTADDYQWLDKFYSEPHYTINEEQQDVIANLHARLFNHKLQKPCTCSPKRWKQLVDELRTIYNEYKNEESQVSNT